MIGLGSNSAGDESVQQEKGTGLFGETTWHPRRYRDVFAVHVCFSGVFVCCGRRTALASGRCCLCHAVHLYWLVFDVVGFIVVVSSQFVRKNDADRREIEPVRQDR